MIPGWWSLGYLIKAKLDMAKLGWLPIGFQNLMLGINEQFNLLNNLVTSLSSIQSCNSSVASVYCSRVLMLYAGGYQNMILCINPHAMSKVYASDQPVRYHINSSITRNLWKQGSTLTVVRLGIPSSFCCRTTWTYVYGCPLVKLRKLIKWIIFDRPFISDWVNLTCSTLILAISICLNMF